MAQTYYNISLIEDLENADPSTCYPFFAIYSSFHR